MTRIGTSAFGACTNLSTITIPANVSEIGSCAFISCSKLVSVCFEGDVPSVFMEAAFLSTSESLIFYYYEGTDGWTEGEWTDSYNNTYKTIKLTARPNDTASGKCNDTIFWTLDENGLLTVSGSGEMPGYENFIDKWNKDDIRSVVFGNEITTIGEGAFQDCSALSSVSFPASLNTIGTRAFQNCDALTALSLPEGLELIGECAFEFCDGFSTLTLPDSLKYLGEKAFAECLELTSVTIGMGLEEIGANPFCICPELNSITVDSDNRYFASKNDILFSKDMTTLYVDPNVMHFELKNYQIPDGVIRIANRAYSNCSTLETVTFPASLKTVGDRAFQNCYNLTTINFNDDLETIEGWAFEYCLSLTEITLPAKVNNIDNRAFQYCTNLTKVTFPAALNKIGDNVFDQCPNLVSATFEGNVPSEWSDDVFGTENVNNALVIYYYAGYTNWSTPTWIAPDNTVYNTRALDNPNPPAATDAYSAAISADKEAVLVNETVKITVTADKAFSAAELVLSYDKDLLTFVGFEPASDVQASVDNGTITLVDFGSEKTKYEFTFTSLVNTIFKFRI